MDFNTVSGKLVPRVQWKWKKMLGTNITHSLVLVEEARIKWLMKKKNLISYCETLNF